MKLISINMKIPIATLAFTIAWISVLAQHYETDFVVGGPEDIEDEQRINIFILSDGYQAADEGLFLGKVQMLTTELFGGNSTPFDIYGEYFNVYRIFVPSADPGALHPCLGCSGNPESSCTAYNGISTAFGSTYDTPDPDGNGFHRLLCADATLVNDYITNGALSNHITSSNVTYTTFVLVNSAEQALGLTDFYQWAGCGNMTDEIATFSGGYSPPENMVKGAVHEFGHTFGFIGLTR